MEVERGTSLTNFKIICRNYPSEFILDKNLAKEYFKQFGKIRKVIFKPKQRICTVEYTNKDGFLNALTNAGEYNGAFFKVTIESPELKKKVKNQLWVDEDVKAELEAMSGTAPKSYSLPEEVSKTDKLPKLKRTRNADPNPKKKIKEIQRTTVSSDHLDLINLVKSQGLSIEEKYKILDARDKLIRIKLKKQTQLKSSPTIGTCPDMCPEKERLMRETQHQVALYEQADNGKSMNPCKAVKQYSRSSADQETPLSHELRPVSVLQMTMAYLMHNIIDLCDSSEVNLAEWFHFLWDRTRGIRKDITQQELCCKGAVELVEQCARFHIHCSARLVAEDPSVFDQKINTENLTKCLQSLKYMYHDLQLKGESCSNEAEFRAYIILLNLNDGNFMWEVQQLRQDIQKSKEVKFALEVYSAIDKNNYAKFFKLVYATTYLNACVLMRYFVQVRIAAIKTLLKCYTPRARSDVYPLTELTNLLGFDDIESTVDFMQAYGISTNDEKTHIILKKNTFVLPDFPYLLERSLNVVESKRTTSVGMVVCGKELPPKVFVTHTPQNSFDEKGYLILKDVLDDFDFEQTKLKATEVEETASLMDTDSVTPSSSDIFSKKPETASIFAPKPTSTQFGKIFAQANQELSASTVDSNVNIFGQPLQTTSSAHQLDIFGNEADKSSTGFQDHTDSLPLITRLKQDDNLEPIKPSNIFFEQNSNSIFANPTSTVANIFGGTQNSTVNTLPFGNAQPQADVFPSQPKGGFTFNLPKTPTEIAASNVYGQSPARPIPTTFFSTPKQDVPISSIKMPITPEPVEAPSSEAVNLLELKKLEEERERIKKEILEEERKEMERKNLEEKKREEERLKEIKRKIQEEELKKRMEQLRREEEELKSLEIQKVVNTVLKGIVSQVESKIRNERLEEIKNNMKRRRIVGMARRWKEIVLKNKRKRKAMDCFPIGVNVKSVKECASDFYTASQDLTLKLRKRYKYGRPLDIEIPTEEKISKVDLFNLTFATLNRRFFELRGILQKTIFWKVAISLPDHYEMRNGLNRIEETLKSAFQWQDRNGTIMAIEQFKPNPMQTITYCIERQRGLFARYADANGIIFIAKDFNSLLQRRILENLKNFGVFTKIPIVIILQEYDKGKCDLRNLVQEEIVSDYIILVENLSSSALVSLVEEGLIFLAGRIEKQPPLELDTLQSFVTKCLCVEIWKKASSFAKWNSHYKNSLKSPNLVISLYNEALEKIKKIILNKSWFEYAEYPEVFKEYLPSEIPDCLPCSYYYFPKFWRSQSYTEALQKILNDLALPEWREKWPPTSELDLEVNMSKYCVNIYQEPEKPFYKVMSTILQNIDPNVNFENIKYVLWTDIVEVLSLEKLRQANLSFVGTPFETKSIFNQYIVVYHVETLEEYKKSDWFYINHPLVKQNIERQLSKRERSETKPEVKFDSNLNLDLDKIISNATKKLLHRSDTSKIKKDMADFNALLDDLESSIKIHKKISSTIEDNLKKALKDN